MGDNRISTIIFDIGNVLVDFRWKEFIEEHGYKGAIADRIARASVLNEDWKEYDLGFLDEDAIIDKFVENDPGIENDLRRTYKSLTGLLRQTDYAKPWIRELKSRGYRVLYLSNFSLKADTDCAKELDFIPLTDGGILSYKEKIIKPDPAIYELLTKRYGLNPQECLFFDDTPENVEAARKHGYQAEVFTDYDSACELIP